MDGEETLAPKILLIDVETSPNIAYIWGAYEQNALDFLVERQIICFAWKWLGEYKVNVLSLPMLDEYKKSPQTNKELILRLHSLISSADIVIGHNIDEFDDKMANTDFLKNHLKPIPPHKTIDTLKVAKAKFRFNSNKLGELGRILGLGKKLKTGGFELWAGCLRGDKKAWALMEAYNKQDVVLLEKVYLRMRPWIGNHPNLNALDDRPDCPSCKSQNIVRQGYHMTRTGKKERFQCRDCGRWMQGIFKDKKWKFT